MATRWYDDLNLVRQFGEALSNAEFLESSEEFAEFLRKPQRFNSAYDVWEAAGYPTSTDDEGWDEFVEGISSDDDEGADTDNDD